MKCLISSRRKVLSRHLETLIYPKAFCRSALNWLPFSLNYTKWKTNHVLLFLLRFKLIYFWTYRQTVNCYAKQTIAIFSQTAFVMKANFLRKKLLDINNIYSREEGYEQPRIDQ